MSVSNNRHGHSHDEFVTGLRLQWQERVMTDTEVVVLGADAAPVQIIDATGTGPAVLRLPLAAKDGKMMVVVNIGTQSITVTDDDASPNAVDTQLTADTGVYQKQGAAGEGVWRMIMTGVTAT